MTRAAEMTSICVIRWGARIWGAGAALLWGAFFVEHLVEWFSGGSVTPPLRVWLLQGLHFAMIAGLLAAWRYERAAGAVALAASIVFFAVVAGPRFRLFAATTVPPAVAFIYCGIQSATR